MTSRGNPSISPPAQIPQSRHVNAIPSSTPPPQQYITGPSPALQQGSYEFISQPQTQGQPFLPYQAYGSALNDPRGQPGNSGRGGPPQQNLPQGGGYYQQPGQNMRPQQSQQGPTTHQQYYISTQGPAGLRQRPPTSTQPMVYIPQNFPAGNSVIIPANMYHQPRVPLFQPYPPGANPPYPGGGMYFNGTPWRGGVASAGAPNARPREKKVLSIMDPDTGRNITEELFNRTQATEVEEHHEDAPPVNQNDQDICKTFTRLVADRLKSPDDSNPPGASVDTQGAVGGTPAGPAAAVPSSQQYQQPPPQQQVQQQQQQQPPPLAPSPMMRPHMSGPPPMPPPTHMMRPGMMQQPPTSATPPQDLQHQVLNVNFSMPPPQIPMRQPGPVHMYNPPQQQQHPAHHAPRHSQPQQQPIRTPQMPVMTAPPQQTPSQAQPQPQPQQQVPPSSQTAPPPAQAAPPPSTAAEPAPQAVRVEPSAPEKPKPQVETPPQDNIPAKPAGAPAPVTKTPTPPKEESPTPAQQTEPVAEVKPSPAATVPASKETPASSGEAQTSDKTEEMGKEDVTQGASTQGVKDGRKGKKNKKDINRKEIGGSDMDAFIDDKENETVDTDVKPPLPPSVTERKNSQDKSASQDIKSPATSTPPAPRETPKVTNKEPSPQPLAASPAPVSATTAQLPKEEDKSPAPVAEQDKSIAEPAPAAEPAISAPSSAPTKNQNQQTAEQAGNSIRNNRRLPGQTERRSSQPLDNGLVDDVRGETAPSPPGDTTDDAPKLNHQAYNDENEPPKESVPKQRGEDGKKGQQGGDSDGTPTKPTPEKTVNKVKKDGKEKLQYDRNYLMELRECASSQTKPEGLPNLEIILDRPVINSNRGTSAAPLDFTPAFFQPQTNQRHAPQIGKTGSRGRQRPDVQMPPRVIKSVSLQNDVKPLHQSEKPWKPTPKQMSAGELAEKRKTLESEVLFIMNRLTPTNFERLAVEMRKLNIKTYEDLQELVKIFFDKVTMETKFVEAYALLCKVMCPLRVPPPQNSQIKENQCTFRVVMLTKCQQEFEADKSVIFEDPEEKKKKIESEMPEGPERDAQIENTLYQMKLKRLKFYGNIRFIGELFKLGMLTENIMHDCIYRLLKARDDDSLVSLCNLITTVGQALDTEKAKSRMDQYFAQMAKIAEERKSRIKFTLKDAIDLRSNNWVPRKEQTGPKKIDEVHKDFQQEQATKQFLQSQPLPPRTETPQPGSRRGSRQRQDDKPTDDGWNTVGSKSLRIDASKMKLSKNVVDENSIQLGPGGGMKQFSMWSRGSGAQPTLEPDRPAPAANRFSALRSDEDRRNFQRSPSRGDSGVASRGMRQGPTAGHGRGKIMARSSQEGERRDALNSARSIVGGRSQNSSRDNSWNREDRRQPMGPRGSREGENPMTRSDISLRPNTDSLLPPSAVAPPAQGATAAGFDDEPVLKKLKPMSEEEMEHKAKTILEEYLNVRDLEEAKLCLRELAGQTYLHVLVTACINDVLERSNKERELTGQFFHEMVINNLLSLDLFIKGLVEVLQFAEDMVIDIPMIWTYLAQMIVPLLLGGSMPWSNLPSALKSHLESRCCAKLLAEILLIAKTKTSEAEVAQMWQSSGLEWTAFLEAAEVERFLQDKKLEFTVAPVSGAAPSRIAGPQVDLQKVSEDIEKMVKENAPNKEINAYIDKNVPVDKCEKNFIRALMTAIASSSISASMKASEEVIKARKDVLQNYIRNNPELELQALYAIQALMHRLEHPSGVIVSLFDTLYDEEVISEEAFKQWEKSTDPQELEGKGACSMQLTQFFTWLRENEEPEQSS